MTCYVRVWVYRKMIQALVERRFARGDITNFWLWGEGFCPWCWKRQEATARHYKEMAALCFGNVRHKRTRQTTGFGHVDVVPCVEVSWTGHEVVQVLLTSCASVYLIFIGPWLALINIHHVLNTYNIYTNMCLWWYLCYFTWFCQCTGCSAHLCVSDSLCILQRPQSLPILMPLLLWLPSNSH